MRMNLCVATMTVMTIVLVQVGVPLVTVVMVMVMVIVTVTVATEEAIHLLTVKEQEKLKDIVMPSMDVLQMLAAVRVTAITIVLATNWDIT
jgi:type IV secretory pathway VirB3-like protein